ncbi:MAG: tRNA (N6-isopentenyl adenosine(37)-C2)-methylthiotransferase MiaB [Candidatus Omnitrophica bacterium]|nr:tRNA (N6-isopentenyl adenosine(37)-C2)-methylthiotransferase MiaB [Candidatus Omnitrophota bacterium]
MVENERKDDNTGDSGGKSPKKLRVLLRTFGCQMNEYDSELVRSILLKKDYVFVDSEFEADIIMLNTCSVRENANRKIFGLIHKIRHDLKGKSVLIGVLGCMAADKKEELLAKKNLGVDFIAGPDSYKKLPSLIKKTQETNLKTFDYNLSDTETYSDIYPKREEGINAWVAISRGCNNFCTYCIVPYVRGRERSRDFSGIIKEVKKLAKEGYPQVTLLGQNVNSYNDGKKDFPDLINEISKINEIKRIHFMSPHPKDFPDKLIKVISENPKCINHIHLPMQAGSTRILKLMNRTYTKEKYLKLVSKIRKACPDIAITTDIIVGFPTENEKDFKDTVDVVKKVRFDAAFIFKYSPRTGTVATKKFQDDVSAEKKTERIVKLNEIQKQISSEKNQKLIGTTQEVLIEYIDKNRGDGHFCGRTKTNKTVSFETKNCAPKQFVNIKIKSASAFGLKGDLVS